MAWNTRRSAAPTLPLLAITPHTARTAKPAAAPIRGSRRRQRAGTDADATAGAVVVKAGHRASTSWAPSAPRPVTPCSGGCPRCTRPPQSDVGVHGVVIGGGGPYGRDSAGRGRH